MVNAHQERIRASIQHRLAEKGIDAIVTVDHDVVRLEGVVDSDERRRLADGIVSEIDRRLTVVNHLEVIPLVPVIEEFSGQPEIDQLTDALHQIDSEVVEEAKENQPAGPTIEELENDAGTARPFFAPTDPVVRVGPHGLEMLGGFSETSVDEVAEETHDLAGLGEHVRGDEEIADDVARELAEDALTADLSIQVRVVNGVVHLRGTVSSVQEVEAAEEVAGRVPGVVEVDEDIVIAD